jgi:SAM-dependent methyltransferase
VTASTFDRIASLIDAGETDLATIEVVRAIDACWPEPGRAVQTLPVLAELCNSLGVLRHDVGDLRTAGGCFETALRFVPDHAGARRNLDAVASALAALHAAPPEAPGDPHLLDRCTADALHGARAAFGFEGADVLQLGGAVPRDVARELGARTWIACDPRREPVADAGYEVHATAAAALPFADDSFDLVFSCALERLADVPTVLAEARRVLRPGGTLFAQYAPVWSSAHGHRLDTSIGERAELLSFEHPVLPRWGHLVLSRAQLRRFLALGWDDAAARQADQWIFERDHANNLPEAGHRRAFWESGFHVEHLATSSGGHVPSPSMHAELELLHPDGSDFTVYGNQVVLTKPVRPDLRVGVDRGAPRHSDALPTVTVIVPFDPDDAADAAVASALAQFHAPVEVLVAPLVGRIGGVDSGGVRVLPPQPDVRAAVSAAVAVALGDLVLVLHPADRLVVTALGLLAGALGDDPDLVAAQGGWVLVDAHGVPPRGACPLQVVDEVAVLDGAVVGGALLEAPGGRPGMRATLARRGPLARALEQPSPRHEQLPPLDIAWLNLLGGGAVAAVPGAAVLAHPDAAWSSAHAGSGEASTLLAHALGLLPAVDGAASGRPVTLVVPLADGRHAAAVLAAVLSTTQADLLDVVLVDVGHDDGAGEAVTVAVTEALAHFRGDVSSIRWDGAADDVLEAVAGLVPTPVVVRVDVPEVLRRGWLAKALARIRAEDLDELATSGATFVTASGGRSSVPA